MQSVTDTELRRLPLLIIVQVLMLYNWPGRAQLLQSACEFLTDRDLAPLVCRMI